MWIYLWGHITARCGALSMFNVFCCLIVVLMGPVWHCDHFIGEEGAVLCFMLVCNRCIDRPI